MSAFRTLPLWALVPVMFLLTGGMFFALQLLFSPEKSVLGWGIASLFYAASMSAVFGLLIARARRRAGGPEQLERMRRAYRTGDVPLDADLPTWSAEAERQERLLLRNRWFGPLVFGLLALLGIWLALTESPFWWASVAFFAGFGVVGAATTPRGLRKVARVQEELRRREQTQGTTDPVGPAVP
jgi:membrane protein implicated in regulation of membrane protease activity